MKIIYNEDREVVEKIREGLRQKNGHCPCRFKQSEETMCMCREFRDQIADPDFEGYCHCRLYYKYK